MGRSNPNSRSSELTDPMRRSFSGNPFPKPSLIPNSRTFLPANTPSDFQRRNSVGGREVAAGSFFRDLDDKENEKDQILKPSKARSPATSSKNAKNFMSPTISASSKVTVSPRKKVLVERNEPARTSVPSTTTEAKTTIIRKVTFAEPLQYSDWKSDNGVEQKKFVALSFDGVPNEEMHFETSSLSCEELSGEAVFDMNVPLNSKNVTESSFETVADEPDCVILDPSFKLSPTPTPPPPVSSTFSTLAPLDADPLMPPYDPKTNYLSPRPQFLHYKPKPRIELCKERELGDNNLMSGSFSGTDVTEDTQSEGSQKSENDSSDEVIEEEAGISEPSPAMTSLAEETVEAREVSKPCFFMRSKAIIIALLLLFAVAFISVSVTNSSVMDHPVFQDFYKVYESSDFSEIAKANFDRFSEFVKVKFDWSAQNFHTWFTKSLSLISELISNVRGVHNFGHLQYYNLSVLHEYNAIHQKPIFGPGEKDILETPEVYPPVLNNEESDTALEIDADEDFGDISEEDYETIYGEQFQQDMGVTTAVENAPEHEEVLEGQPDTVIESDQPLQLAEVSEPNHPSEVVIDLNDQPSLDAKAPSEVLEIGNLEVKAAQQECDAKVNVDKFSDVGLKDQPGLDSEVAEIHTEAYGDNDIELTEAEGESTSIDAAIEDNEQRSETNDFLPHLLPIGVTILIAGAAFKWSRKGKSRSTRVTGCVEQPVFAKAFHANLKEEQSYLDKPSLRNGPTEIDMHEESCPSEMSSIQKSPSYRQKVMKELNEVHSLEKKPKKRRESLASSSDYSTSSPSYGSFTTYEKIQIKNGHWDEETITPVRRSSRIRSQATSPL